MTQSPFPVPYQGGNEGEYLPAPLFLVAMTPSGTYEAYPLRWKAGTLPLSYSRSGHP